MFIVFCGIDGSGKTTQLNLLNNYLTNFHHIEPCVLSFPSAEYKQHPLVKQFFTNSNSLNFDELNMLAQLSLNDRKEQVETYVKPALINNKIVLADRYYYSSVVYFSLRCNQPIEFFLKDNLFLPCPDLVFFINTPPKLAYQRIYDRNLNITDEEANFSKIQKTSDLFISLFDQCNDNIITIDGSNNKNNIHKQIVSITLQHLKT